MPNQNTTPSQGASAFHSISAGLLGVAGSVAQKLDLDARLAKALQGPRRFHIHEDFSGGAWKGAAGLIGTDGNEHDKNQSA